MNAVLKPLLLTLTIVLCAWLALLPQGDPLVYRAGAVVLLTLALWGTGSLPPFLTSLIFFALVLTLGLAEPALIFAGFGSTAVWLIISGFVIGAAITLSGLGQRLAALLEPRLAGSYPRLIGG
ncbi:anion permease, partial [Aeromonas diversa]